MFAKRFRILHTSRIRKRRHKDPSCVRAPSVALVIVVPHYSNTFIWYSATFNRLGRFTTYYYLKYIKDMYTIRQILMLKNICIGI